MFDPYFDSEAFDFSKLVRGNRDRLTGLLLLKMPDEERGESLRALLAQEAARIISHYSSGSTFSNSLEGELIEAERQARSSGSAAFFIGAFRVSAPFCLHANKDIDEYTLDLVFTPQEYKSMVANIASHYFFLYTLQKRFMDKGKTALTLLDIPQEEVLPKLYGFCSRLLFNAYANSPDGYAAVAEELRSFAPGKIFAFNIDELVRLSFSNSNDKVSNARATLQCKIIEAIVKEDYVKASLLHKEY